MALVGGFNRRRFDTGRFALIVEPPTISSVSVSGLSGTGATINWTTNQPANSLVNYGATTAYGSTSGILDDPPETLGVTSHSVVLTGLTAGNTYHFQIISANAGEEASRTVDATLTTPSGVSFFQLDTWPNFNTMGFLWWFSGDNDVTATCPFTRLSTTATAALSATSVAVPALPCGFPSGTRFVFFNGVVGVLSADVALGATALPVVALSGAVPSGTTFWVSGVLFKVSTDTQWRMGIAAARTDWGGTDPGDGTQRGFAGKLLKLQQNTSYDLQVRITRAGVEYLGTATASTRADNFSTVATMLASATRFVDPSTGLDTNDGLTRGTAWRTLAKAMTTATAGVTVELGPGHIKGYQPARTTQINLVARFPAVINDATRAVEPDTSKHTIIYSGYQTAPTGTVADPNAEYTVAPWTSYTNPNGLTVWRWSPGPATTITQCGFASNRNDPPQRLAGWNTSAASTADAWIDLLFTHIGTSGPTALVTRYGWFSTSTSPDVYLVMPPWATSSNPNDYWMTFGPRTSGATGELLKLNAPNSRVCGVRFDVGSSTIRIGTATAGQVNCDNTLIDHCAFYACYNGILPTGADAPGYVRSGNRCSSPTVQYCSFNDSNLSDINDTSHTLDWYAIKGSIKRADSTLTGGRLLANSEGNGVFCSHWVSGLVVRYCTIDGTFNGIGPLSGDAGTGTVPWRREYCSYTDIHDCLIKNIADDSLEPEKAALSLAIWSIRFENVYTYVSLAPVTVGPVYVFDTEGWNGTPMGNRGTATDQTHVGYKFGGNTPPSMGRVYHLDNIWWTDAGAPATTRSRGSGKFASGPAQWDWNIYNSGFRATDKAFETAGVTTSGAWREDYNLFGSTGRGLDYNNTTLYTAIASYRTGSGQGAHTNVVGGSDLDLVTGGAARFLVDFTDPPSGLLTRKAGSAINTAGMPFPNMWDMATPETSWSGAAPPIGPALSQAVAGGGGLHFRRMARVGIRGGSRQLQRVGG